MLLALMVIRFLQPRNMIGFYVRISRKSDSDFAKSRTAVSLMSGQSGGSGPRVPCCVHG